MKLLVFLLFLLFGIKSLSAAHAQGDKLFGILLGRFVFSPPFIYLFIYLYQYGLLGILFCYNPVPQHFFFAKSIPALATGSSFGLSLVSLRHQLFDILVVPRQNQVELR